MNRGLRCLLILALLFLSACATPHYGARIELFSERLLDSSRIHAKADRIPEDQAKRVQVFIGQLPAGLSVRENELVVVPPYRHRILGKVTTTGLDGYNEDRKGYCIGKEWVAKFFCLMGATNIIPLFGLLACPCVYGRLSNSREDIALRRAALIRALQRVTLAAGGNAVILESLGDTVVINRNTDEAIGTHFMTGASGYAVRLRRRPRGQEAPPRPAAPRPPAVSPGGVEHM